MKTIAILTALGLASAALVAVAAPDGNGRGEKLKAADTNGDGMISREEAKALPRLAKHFDAIDANKDGKLSADELSASREKRRGEGWKKLDTNGDGKISKAEAQANAPRLAENFDQLDANKDGFVTPEEMKAAHAGSRKGK
jgi:Ca2+-binding EF-hand superfamily protein